MPWVPMLPVGLFVMAGNDSVERDSAGVTCLLLRLNGRPDPNTMAKAVTGPSIVCSGLLVKAAAGMIVLDNMNEKPNTTKRWKDLRLVM